MSTVLGHTSDIAAGANFGAPDGVRPLRVLLAGLGNIGSFTAMLLAPLVSFVRLVDRDTVELRNTANQLYGPEDEGQTKVDVFGARIAQVAPELEIERRVADLEDLPWEDFADVDVALAGLDSLRARQVLSEKLYTLQVPYIDGAVGDPLLTRVQVLLPNRACLECSWGKDQYRQVSTEVPCHPGASAQAAPTGAPGCAGAATAALMVAQLIKLYGEDPPVESYEINGDMLAGRFVTARRRRNQACRFSHEAAPQMIRVEQRFGEATVADIMAVLAKQFGEKAVQLEFRRGIIASELFGAGRYSVPEQLTGLRHRRLDEIGLTPRDRIVVREAGRTQAAHICFDSTSRRPT